jgi:RHS repeat-associated protein
MNIETNKIKYFVLLVLSLSIFSGIFAQEIPLNGVDIAEVRYETGVVPHKELTYLHNNYQNSPVLTTGENGQILQNNYYDIWGTRVATSTATTTIQSREGYTGHITDEETGNIYAHARYLNPTNKIFTTQDPYFWSQVTNEAYLFDPQAQNSYSYARNNPTTYTDPTGEYVESALDIAFIANDLKNINQNIQDKNYSELGWNILSLIGDGASLAAPGVTGVGLGVKVVGKETVQGVKSITKLSDDALVCRGGSCGVDSIIRGSDEFKKGQNVNPDTVVSGISVNVSKTKTEIVKNLPGDYKKAGFSNLKKIENIGGKVVPAPTKNNPFHSVINGLTPKQINQVFKVKKIN